MGAPIFCFRFVKLSPKKYICQGPWDAHQGLVPGGHLTLNSCVMSTISKLLLNRFEDFKSLTMKK